MVDPAISNYGVVAKDEASGQVLGIVEKLSFEEVQSDIASVGCYVLTPEIFDILQNLPAGIGREVHLADAINIQV